MQEILQEKKIPVWKIRPKKFMLFEIPPPITFLKVHLSCYCEGTAVKSNENSDALVS